MSIRALNAAIGGFNLLQRCRHALRSLGSWPPHRCRCRRRRRRVAGPDRKVSQAPLHYHQAMCSCHALEAGLAGLHRAGTCWPPCCRAAGGAIMSAGPEQRHGGAWWRVVGLQT